MSKVGSTLLVAYHGVLHALVAPIALPIALSLIAVWVTHEDEPDALALCQGAHVDASQRGDVRLWGWRR